MLISGLTIEKKIKSHTYSKNINLIQGNSIAQSTIKKLEIVLKSSKIKNKKIMVCLDSNHTHDHVFQELSIVILFQKIVI